MTLNIGPQHPATHGTLRIIVRLDGEQVVWAEPSRRLHAPRVREAHRGAHVPAGDDADQPHRLAGQLRQRGAVHPRRREVDGHRGAAARPVDPHDPVRAQPHRQRRSVPRRPRRAAGCHHAGVHGVPRPRVRAEPHRSRHRRSLPSQLRPHRRPEGRPARRLDHRDQAGDEEAAQLLRRDGRPAVRQRDLPEPHARHRRHPSGRRHAVRPQRRQPARQRRRLGSAPRPEHCRWRGTRST